jgi:hypothetical protein
MIDSMYCGRTGELAKFVQGEKECEHVAGINTSCKGVIKDGSRERNVWSDHAEKKNWNSECQAKPGSRTPSLHALSTPQVILVGKQCGRHEGRRPGVRTGDRFARGQLCGKAASFVSRELVCGWTIRCLGG